MVRVYLASPYSHTDAEVVQYRYRQNVQRAAELMQAGLCVFSPICHSHDIGGHLAMRVGGHANDAIHKFWMRQDKAWLSMCDAMLVLQLDGWDESRGVREEQEHCSYLNVPVFLWNAQEKSAARIADALTTLLDRDEVML